jgi:hypothetical protein
MKAALIFSILLLGFCAAPEKLPEIEGPYLGQTAPGNKAEVFAPGIISTKKAEGCSGFLKNGTVFVWSAMDPDSDWRYKSTFWMELRDGKWTEAEPVPFNDLSPYNFTVAPDDKSLYFTAIRSPEDHGILLEQSNIWVVVKTVDRWSDPLMLGPSINTDPFYENYPSVTTDGTIYYMSRREEGMGKTDIYRSRWFEGIFQNAENLGPVINTEESDQDPFIAPDESYLIVCLDKEEGYGGYDLYVSFRLDDGAWSPPRNMGKDINSPGAEFRPYVTPDGRYLFFTSSRSDSGNGDIYWVDAAVISDLKQELSSD